MLFIFYYRLLKKHPQFEFDFRDHMQFKNVNEKIATYWLMQNRTRAKRPSLQVPPRVPMFTAYSPPSTPGLITTPISPKDFNRQLSSRLNQLQYDSFPSPSVMKVHNNPSIVVDSPGHHDKDHNSHSEPRASSSFTKPFGWGCCMAMSTSNRVAQDPSELVCHKFSSTSNSSQESGDGRKDSFESGRKDSLESGRKDSHDSGILVNPTLQRVPENETINSRQRRPGICVSHQSSNVSEICQRFEEIVEEHKTKQERLAARKSSEGPQESSILEHKYSTVSI